jgi:hypothetical protein
MNVLNFILYCNCLGRLTGAQASCLPARSSEAGTGNARIEIKLT